MGTTSNEFGAGIRLILVSAFSFLNVPLVHIPPRRAFYTLTVQQKVTSRPESRKTVFPLRFQKVFPFALSLIRSRNSLSIKGLRVLFPSASTVLNNVGHQSQIVLNKLIPGIIVPLGHPLQALLLLLPA